MSNEIQKQNGNQAVSEYSPADVVRQVAKIQEIMKVVMKRDEHYGVIPGCGDKPTLLKSGAEKLAFTFRLAPDFVIEQVDQNNGHREYRVVTRITNSVTGDFLGSGVGAASTMETKWRYRSENTGKPVPSEYWVSRDQSLLGGSDYSARKMGKTGWTIVHKIEHDNPADYYNTCLKMAKKRSLVDAILTCTAASDLFSQDLEELKENGLISDDDTPASQPEMKRPQAKAAPTKPTTPARNEGGGRTISEKQGKLIYAKSKGKDMPADVLKGIVKSICGVDHSKDIPTEDMDAVLKAIEDWSAEPIEADGEPERGDSYEGQDDELPFTE